MGKRRENGTQPPPPAAAAAQDEFIPSKGSEGWRPCSELDVTDLLSPALPRSVKHCAGRGGHLIITAKYLQKHSLYAYSQKVDSQQLDQMRNLSSFFKQQMQQQAATGRPMTAEKVVSTGGRGSKASFKLRSRYSLRV